jgi:hypothetical protein
MLTVTETITRELNTDEKLAFDNDLAAENLLKAFKDNDKENALSYAKILMLKAMCMKR